MTSAYANELTLEQWDLLESLLPAAKSTGRPRQVNLMQVMQAILYVLVSGCAWRLLPKDYPPYSTVYYYFRQWRDDGTWQRVHDQLVQWVRVAEGHPSTASAGSLDSQTVPTAVMVHHSVGWDGAKHIKGRKRFTLVDTFGLLIALEVMAANVPEREEAKALLHQVYQRRVDFPRLTRIWVDSGFSGHDFTLLGDGHVSPDSGCGFATRGSQGLCPAAQALDGRTNLWLAACILVRTDIRTILASAAYQLSKCC